MGAQRAEIIPFAVLPVKFELEGNWLKASRIQGSSRSSRSGIIWLLSPNERWSPAALGKARQSNEIEGSIFGML